MNKTTSIETPATDFITRTLKTTGILLLLTLAVGPAYFRFYDCLAVFSAGVWSMINLLFLAALVRTAVRPGHIDKLRTAGLAVLKFPLLYLSGYFLVTLPIFRIVPILIGLSSVLAVMSLKAVGQAIMGTDEFRERGSEGVA
ncbi:MAG: hypothetical protein PHR28_00685 [candidate division Zixibacteria bacterium]|nr:hypothetical protein [candidate division Zixibacteria bacterium]